MTENSFTTINGYTLEEIHMIAGDTKTFYYNILDENNGIWDLTGHSGSIIIFPYGDSSHVVVTASCVITGSPTLINRFSAVFSGSGLSGMYTQQIRMKESDGTVHIPAQGKIFIFPSPE